MKSYSFGNFLHELRMRAGLTQYQLGALVGVSDKAVSKWENGSSAPQIGVLYKLSEVLGISVDGLLSCKYRSFENKGSKGVFAMKNQLWNKACDALYGRYGEFLPIEISNRFFAEKAEMQESDVIVYFDMLSFLASEAKKQGEHIRVNGGTGASFVAYVMGATEVNPLKAHYYCPECKNVIFDGTAADGWDLAERKCSCQALMQRDGHNIPYETYRHVLHRNASFAVSVSPRFLSSAAEIVKQYFNGCKTGLEEREEGKILILSLSYGERQTNVTFFADQELARCKALESATATDFSRIGFACKEVLSEFQKGNTDGILEFRNRLMKDILNSTKPVSFGELLQTFGLSHGTGVWFDNAQKLTEDGISLTKVISYRDDVFNYVRERSLKCGLADSGFAYKVMEDARRGVYLKNGIPASLRSHLFALGADEWFIKSISKIRYLFPKAHAVEYMKTAAIQMWYKINYPKEFKDIMN